HQRIGVRQLFFVQVANALHRVSAKFLVIIAQRSARLGLLLLSEVSSRRNQIGSAVPNIWPYFDRFSEPNDCVIVILHDEVGSSNDPVKRAGVWIAGAEGYCLQHQRRSLL